MNIKNKLLDFGTNPLVSKFTKPIVETVVNAIGGKPADIKTVHERLQICRKNTCGNYIKKGENEVCNAKTGGCGCFLADKTRLADEQCPKKLW
ncbi:MAG TPA: hypothetical protein PK239_14775 [Chitinophagales bacterium]|nr:hypothetical protein [Chitinophagales bacterium]HRK28538.1 hypothetical protein [Chitinophagales bacterium]